jgi:hypothetical protein
VELLGGFIELMIHFRMVNRKSIARFTVLVTGVFLISSIAILSQPAEATFRFAAVDHPVDIWAEGSNRWAYFSVGGTRSLGQVASEARGELVAQGFHEDRSRAPWVRYLKGDQEVVICTHSEFSVGSGGKLLQNKGRPDIVWPVVLVKNGPGTHGSLQLFQVKKLIHGW